MDPTLHGGPPRLMHYCHDTYGLGHLRRTLTLAGHLARSQPDVSQLVVTGSPVAGAFPYPPRTDYVKLPSVTKTGADRYEARSIATDFAVVRNMRRSILASAAEHFAPDLFLVDHAPAGLKGEAVSTLRALREHSPRTRLVVGLRDVIDDASQIRRAWAKEGVYELLDDLYDLILVYGHQHFYDVVAEYGLSPRAAAKTRFVGYLGREPPTRAPAEIRASLPLQTDRLVVVTAGGGGDGAALFQAVLGAARRQSKAPAFDCLVVGGPLMEDRDRAHLRELAGASANLHVLDFSEEMTSYLAAADAVVSMGGYNTVCEILSLGRPAVVVPRVAPRVEQLLRAEALSRRGLIRLVRPESLTADRLLGEIASLLTGSTSDRRRLPMTGLAGVERELRALWPTRGWPVSGLHVEPDRQVSVSAAD